jgi:hypothetical protein
MKTKLHSTFDIRHSALIIIGTAVLAAITLFTGSPRAPAQTGPGYALSFNGTNSYVAVNAQNVPIGNSDYSLEAWILPNSMGNYGIIGWGTYGTTNQVNSLSLRTNGLANSWWGNDLVATNTGLAGAWHHVAATFDGTSRKIYLDGVLVASNSPANHNVTTRANLSIGLVGAADYFNGTIDEVRVWGEARTQAQIQTNRFIRLSGNESGLMAYWKLDEGSGTNAADTAGPWNPGTLMNNPVWVRSTVPFTPEAATSNATSITTASARLNALVHAGNLPANAWFQWGSTTSYGTNLPLISVGPGLPADTNALAFQVGSVLTNLTTNTTYHFRVAVTNSVGTNYGADMAFTTSPLPTGPGCALAFLGTNNYVQTPDLGGSFPPANSNLTIELWFNAQGPGVLVDEVGGGGCGWHESQIEVVTTATNSAWADVHLHVWSSPNLPGIIVGQVPYGTWNQVVLRYNQASFTLDGFLNNVPGPSLNVIRVTPQWSCGSVFYYLGQADSTSLGSGAYFDGQIDEFRVWNVARSTADIQANAFRPLLGNEPGLTVYWRLDDCSGSVATDTTGHGYNGTLYGNVTWSSPSTVPLGPGVTTLPATNLTLIGAALMGSVHPQGFATTAWFEWGTTTNYGNTGFTTNVGNGTNFVTLSPGLTGLSPSTTYHFRVVGTNSYGIRYGQDQSFWLGTPVVVTLPASDITTNAATLNSTIIPSGPSAQAWFQWGLATNYGSVTAPGALLASTLPTSVTNRVQPLLSGITYHYRIVATNGFGASYGGDLAFTTPYFGQVTTLAGGVNAVAWGDFDNDGDLDIVVTGTLPNTKIYRNDGNGVFTDVSVPLTAVGYSSVAVGDYDNDGWLDLLLMGYTTGPTGVTELWRNTGAGWVKTNTPLPGVYYGSAAFGDYDNDGRPDILIAGYTGSSTVAQVWRNTGSGWSNINAGLPGVFHGSVAWGDYDNDGWLDILLTGTTDGTAGGAISRVYHNNGDGTFTDIHAGLPGVFYSSAAWGDFDNDGRLDILLAGTTSGSASGAISRVYHNNGNGTFTDIHAGLPGTYSGSAAWGDFKNDGMLDILLTGSAYPSGVIARIYQNNGDGTFSWIPTAGLSDAYAGQAAVGDYDKDGRLDIVMTDSAYITHLYHNYWPVTNNPPTSPANLVANIAGTDVQLSWAPGRDSQTPIPGLSYNLRVGTAPGASNVVAPAAAGTGWRRVPQLGNAQQNLSSWLTGLKYGSNYYWSVQAIDSAYAGSPFANEVMFAVTLAPSASPAQVGSIMGNSALVSALIYPNGANTTAYIQWGTTAGYGNNTAVTNVGSGAGPASLFQLITGLMPGVVYHYRIVTSNANGSTYGADQTVYLNPNVLIGDANGDGIISEAELDAVLANYWPTSPWLSMTNTAGLGRTNVTFALTNSIAGAFSVECSTNLVDWLFLGPATPRYEFTDTNAPAMPQRFYRLRWP